MILKDVNNPVEPIEVARKELPYSFDVRSSTPRTKGPASHHTHQANIISPSNIRGRAKHPSPVATIHSEDTSSGIDVLFISPASDAGAQPVSHGDTYRGQSCVSSNFGQQEPPLFTHAPNSAFEEVGGQIRSKVADREAKISTLEGFIKQLKDTFEADGREKDAALQPLIDYLYGQILVIQKEIADRLNAFAAERKKAEATVSAEVATIEAQIRILKQENHHDASVLNAAANPRSWIGYDDWSEADSQGWTSRVGEHAAVSQ